MADHAGFDPSKVFVYRGKGSVPKNVRRAEVDRSVEEIPVWLFEDCQQLESALLHEGLLGIGESAFDSCTSLRSLQCPSTVTKIGMGAFMECSNLAVVELPEGLEEIERAAFRYCRSLAEVKIPALVPQIGGSAFSGCTNLASVELRQGLRTIGDCAFDGCRSLESLCVPPSVDKIEEHAFDGCSSLTLVRLHKDIPRIRRCAFRGCPLESFQFAGLSERMAAIRMDDQMASMFDSRLREITSALTEEDDYYEEGDSEAVREKCKESLGKAHDVLTYLELKGAAPVLELALWKAKFDGKGVEEVQGESVNNKDGGQDLSDTGRERKRPKVTKNIRQDTRLSREDCRVKCGAGIVIPEVLKFFTYSLIWSQMDFSEEEDFDY